ncbi:retrotransposon gag domain, retroviral aspartyl protease [Tanacetum coccineum]|uniref:Retrotransposon gag domain, retroviral aspartyl protease n=1 Tax=Tanacetum coccineum TaxID=301880 RepID=A0ABQ5F491_9ASTR
MVQTRNNPDTGSGANDPIDTQLAAIATKLEAMESLKEDIADLKRQAANKQRSGGSGSRYEEVESSHSNHNRRPFHKIEFPVFSEKVDVAAMHLEGDALDLYSWMSAEHEIIYWEELINVLQKHFGPPEFQNPDEYLCSIKQTGYVHEYRQEFAQRSTRISNWPDHCLLGVFLNGLKDELKADVRIYKPRTVYKAMSLALEFESKINHCRPEKKTTWNSQLKPDSKPFTAGSYSPVLVNQPKPDPKSNLRITDAEKQNCFLKGECFRCGDKYGLGHRCKTGTFKVLEAEEENGEQREIETSSLDIDPDETAGISLHAILGKPHPTTMKIQGKLNSTEDLSLQVNDLKIIQDFHPFSLGGADLVLGIQWLATLNTVQANWKDLFMIFTIDGKRYKLKGVQSGPQKSSSFQHLAIEPEITPQIPSPLQPIISRYSPIFDKPQAPTPNRCLDHFIPLIPNETPPNICPYRYPHSQKTELEKQVEQL